MRELTVRLAERLKGIKYASESSARRATVNHAIALKELGRTGDMETVLSSIDWSASAPEFKLALHALRNKEDEFYQLLPRAIAADAVTKGNLEVWPLFNHQRGTERFAEALEKHFGGGSPGGSGSGEGE